MSFSKQVARKDGVEYSKMTKLKVFMYTHTHGWFQARNFPTRGAVKQELDWPTPAEIARVNIELPLELNKYPEMRSDWEHLILGVNLDAAMDWMQATGWPAEYVRSDADEIRNGRLMRGQEIGYDLAVHIRKWLVKMGYELFCVAEVLRACGHPGVGRACCFLSHVQAELVHDTLLMLMQIGEWQAPTEGVRMPAFVDYFSLRQKQDDAFDPAMVFRCIGEIGFTYFGLTPIDNGTLFERIWCLYEVYCSVTENCRMWALNPHNLQLGGVQRYCYESSGTARVAVLLDIRNAKSSKDKDRDMIKEKFRSALGSVSVSNRILRRALITITTLQRFRPGQSKQGIRLEFGNPDSLNGRLLDLETGKIRQWLLCGFSLAGCKYVDDRGTNFCLLKSGQLVSLCECSEGIRSEGFPNISWPVCDTYYGCCTIACKCGRCLVVLPTCRCTLLAGCGACGWDYCAPPERQLEQQQDQAASPTAAVLSSLSLSSNGPPLQEEMLSNLERQNSAD